MTHRSTPAPARRSGPGRLRATAAAELPDRLLDAAQRVFTRSGYAGATMDAVARAAGTTRKTLYARYPDKAGLLSAVVARLLDRTLASMQPVAISGLAVGDGLRSLAQQLVQLTVDADVTSLNRLILYEAAQLPELARLFVDLHGRAAESIRVPLEGWRAEGRLPGWTIDAGAAAGLFVEMACSMPRLRAVLGLPMSRREIAAHVDHAVALFLAAAGGAGPALTPPARTTPPTAPPPPPPAPRRAARTRR